MLDAIAQGDFTLQKKQIDAINERLRIEYVGEQLLIDAVAKKDKKQINLLLQQGVLIDAKGSFSAKRGDEVDCFSATPLLVAAYLGDMELLNFILAKNPLLETQHLPSMHSALEALIFSSSPNKYVVLEFLLAKGMDPNAFFESKPENYHRNPLLEAVEQKDIRFVEMLLEKNVQINYIDHDGDTAITKAIKADDVLLVKRLLTHHPKLHYTFLEYWENETQHVSAFDIARQSNNVAIAGLVALAELQQTIGAKLGLQPDNVSLSVNADEVGKPSVHVGFADIKHANQLKNLVDAKVRFDAASQCYYVRMGSVRISALFGDVVDGHARHAAIAAHYQSKAASDLQSRRPNETPQKGQNDAGFGLN